jgi:hypothetical protein
MKALIAIVIIVAAAVGGWQIYSTWVDVNQKENEKHPAQTVQTPVSGADLPGMVPQLEPILQAAQQQGAPGLRRFLTKYGRTIADPRLAWIELDYVVLVANDNPAEAKQTFARVKQRVTQTSPVYSRVKQLEKTYQ